nr:hypothetical protein [uncultured Psychroserpens sp.]
MKKSIIYSLLAIMLFACSEDNETNEPFTLEGKTYQIVAYKVESNMDLNGDGVFSTNLLLECADPNYISNQLMKFVTDSTAYYPMGAHPIFGIVNGEQYSTITSPARPTIPYIFQRPNIRFIEGVEPFLINTVISDDNQTITTRFKIIETYGLGHNLDWRYFNQAGEIETYTGDFIITLELQN